MDVSVGEGRWVGRVWSVVRRVGRMRLVDEELFRGMLGVGGGV